MIAFIVLNGAPSNLKGRKMMSRTTLGLILGGVLMLAAAGCAQQPLSETTSSEIEGPEAGFLDAGIAEAQSPEAEGKPVVTVSRSPT